MVLAMSNSQSPCFTVEVNGVEIDIITDSAATCSIIDEYTLKKLF